MTLNIIYTDAFLSRDAAETARDTFLADYDQKIQEDDLVTIEDEIKLINNHYVVRILIGDKQLELDV